MHDDTESPEEQETEADVATDDVGSEAGEDASAKKKRSKAAAEAAALAEEFLQQLSRGNAGLGDEATDEVVAVSEDAVAGAAILESAEAEADADAAAEERRATRAERRARTLEMVAQLERRALEAEARVAELTKENEGHYEARLRLQADFENHRKRIQREREEQARYGNEDLLKELLPTIDNLERAVQHAEEEGESGPFVDGVKITLNQFLHVISKFGVEPFDSEGEPFDPQLHDAMSQVPTDEMPPNHVASQFVKGYHYHERLLRPAMVSVSMAPPEPAPAPSTPATDEAAPAEDDAAEEQAAEVVEDGETGGGMLSVDETDGPTTEVVSADEDAAESSDDDEGEATERVVAPTDEPADDEERE